MLTVDLFFIVDHSYINDPPYSLNEQRDQVTTIKSWVNVEDPLDALE
jgi:hypothetical protein